MIRAMKYVMSHRTVVRENQQYNGTKYIEMVWASDTYSRGWQRGQ